MQGLFNIMRIFLYYLLLDLGIWLANNGKAVKGHMLGSLLVSQLFMILMRLK